LTAALLLAGALSAATLLSAPALLSALTGLLLLLARLRVLLVRVLLIGVRHYLILLEGWNWGSMPKGFNAWNQARFRNDKKEKRSRAVRIRRKVGLNLSIVRRVELHTRL
jgi:hypothetical protein